MLRIGFLSCTKKKKEEADKAKNLYLSPSFSKAREYAERCYDKWYILSAKYHLLSPERVIEPYDETLTAKSNEKIKEWSIVVFRQIQKEMPNPQTCILFIHAGERYRRHLITSLLKAGYCCRVPLFGLSIGKQLAWYNKYNREERCLT